MTTPQLDVPQLVEVPVDVLAPVRAALEALLTAVLALEDDGLRLLALDTALDGRVARELHAARQRIEPWGSWMHSDLLDSAPAGVFENEETRQRLDGPDGANLLYSKAWYDWRPDDEADHIPMFDIDLPMRVVPSSTPGKGHLYINKPMPWAKVEALLAALVEAGVVHKNYLKHSQARSYTCLRPAFQRKPANHSSRLYSSDYDEDDQ